MHVLCTRKMAFMSTLIQTTWRLLSHVTTVPDLSCAWYTPILHNSDTVLTARHYELLPQQVSDLTTQVDAKYIVSVVELQQEDNHYCLSNDHLSVISSYIKETASAFAPDVPTSQSGSKKVPATKTKNCTSISSSALGSDTRAYSTTSSSRATKKRRSYGWVSGQGTAR